MGADRPGDLDYLNSIVRCKIGVITLIGPVHLEYFGSIDQIQKEKGKLIEQLPKDGYAILNYDNEKTRQIKNVSKAKVLTYGFDEKVDVRAREMIFSFIDDKIIRGVSFKITYQGSSVPVFLPNVLGSSVVYAALAGATVGLSLGLNLVNISQALREFKSPRGRMNIISGLKQALIIDDTYNSSPQAAIAALEVLQAMPVKEGARRIAVLGDMLELGSYSEAGHQEVGKYLAKLKIDKLISVGERARDFCQAAKQAGMAEAGIIQFADTLSASKFVREIIKEGDIVLVKGSQGMRMEKIVKEIMAEPQKAKDLLVRQEEEWLKK
ncbi:MAG: UDP-N-acetylmuramoyl-tripeptide--D-alanyl-D-alanine ligase, partial [Candidatus Falkowbacteria bacterium]|nr:UDP-N-acetylmuramoyl-tripeptide--D-alanyl-D-alanine ligase [Candidatus Falkowbacteria bacterium]